ncbi:MAG TPA: DUF5063 domain-containing protein [Bacteroidales bacterium]|nr:DUF5063 domain-containing protein [Bacteroidales bacterium]
MDIKDVVYSRNVVEFVTVAKEFCAFLEGCEKHTARSFVGACNKVLPLLYYKATLLPETEPVYDETNEQFVTESDYSTIENKVEYLLGQHNQYVEVNDPRVDELTGLYTASIAEYLADIYQDLKNFVLRYQVGNTYVMNDALWECINNFKDFWGIRLANLIRAFHILAHQNIDLDNIKHPDKSEGAERNTSDWFVTRRQQDMDHNELM